MVVISDPTLNISADDLGKDMIRISPQGDVTDILETATGVIGSPAPYIKVAISFTLNKTSSVCQRYLNKMFDNTQFNNLVLNTDSSTLAKIVVQNAFMSAWSEASFSGLEPGIGFTVTGFVPVNNSMFGD